MTEDDILASASPGKKWAVTIILNARNGINSASRLPLQMARDALGMVKDRKDPATGEITKGHYR